MVLCLNFFVNAVVPQQSESNDTQRDILGDSDKKLCLIVIISTTQEHIVACY